MTDIEADTLADEQLDQMYDQQQAKAETDYSMERNYND